MKKSSRSWTAIEPARRPYVALLAVLGTAYAYPSGVGYEGVPVGLQRARQALVFNTSNTPAAREREVFGDPLERLWGTSVFALCGVPRLVRRLYGPMAGSSAAQREAWLDEVRALVEQSAGDG